MGKKCSNCGSIGHNSRTCTIFKGSPSTTTSVNNNNEGGFRLFGVELLEISSSSSSSYSSSITTAKNKSFISFDSSSSPSPSPSSSPSLSSPRFSANEIIHEKMVTSSPSNSLICKPRERKKGVPWTEEEHKAFLIGLEKLGKGDWRGISRNFVTTRTSTQIASHAQKYFLRASQITLNNTINHNNNKKNLRSSLFDMVEHNNNNIKQQQQHQLLDLDLTLGATNTARDNW